MAPSAYRTIQVDPVAGALGAVVRDLALAPDLPPLVVRELRAAWLRHGVLFFHDQVLSPGEFQAVAERFGTITEYPFIKGLPDHPLVIEVLKLPHETRNFGGIWHTDTAYLKAPPMATMLIAREVPPFGGDTLFASGVAAYEALSPGMKKMLAGLKAVNASAKADVTRTREDRMKDAGRTEANPSFVATHPVVRTHPETKRKSLYVNPGHTVRFEGMLEAESAPLLDYLFAHQTQPEFTCRFAWRVGSIALWDNRCVLHNPVNDYHGYKRLMHRVTLKGAVPK
jgi:taurine dioxygenase